MNNDYIRPNEQRQYPNMVVMVTCSHCGYEYQSKALQTPDEETLVSETRENIVENCLKCNKISNHNVADFYWIDPSELE